MNEVITNSAFFGIALSFIIYIICDRIKRHIKTPLFNPLLISSVIIILLLLVFHIDYETYNNGARYITFWLTPATVCLAVPLYRRIRELKENLPAVLIGITMGCLSHVAILLIIAFMTNLDKTLLISVLPKSVTTAIALGLSERNGGIVSVTVVGVCIAGMMGAVVGPYILRLFHIKEPVAQGLAIGTASHAVGTSKAVEMGPTQAAMSSLAIVVTGILTVIIVPIVAKYL